MMTITLFSADESQKLKNQEQFLVYSDLKKKQNKSNKQRKKTAVAEIWRLVL